jgi:eukaryotic-like serine/threonine-protein kinase
MGEVYRAFDEVLARPVALKILRERTLDTPAQAKKGERSILREARTAAALHHPNVVAVYDLGEHEGVMYLAMELVRGRSLRSFVGRPGVSVERRLGFLLDVARALDAAHRAGIVHRDVKPENVMVCDDGSVKVLDFGIAHQTAPAPDGDVGASTETETLATLTAGSSLAGTPPYMAPEQVRRGEIDGRADQFAWGVVAYEVLSGKLPWTRTESLFDVVSSVLHELPRRLCEVSPEVPDAVDAAVMRALAKDRTARFARMGDLLQALSSFDAAASKDGALPPADPDWAGPNELTVTASGIQTAAGSADPHKTLENTGTQTTEPGAASAPGAPGAARDSGAPAEDAVRSTRASPPAPEPPAPQSLAPQPPRRRRWMWVLGAALAGAAAGGGLLVSRAVHPVAAGVAITDLPAPMGCNAAALAEHRRGIAAMRDGAWEQAHGSFERAVAADPGCASAALRLSMTGLNVYPIARTREVYRRVVELRAELSERDQLLLDALDPMIRHDPSDERMYEERLRALSARYPGDAELASIAASRTQDPAEKSALARQALAIDPRYADAMQLLGEASLAEGRPEEAQAMFERCTARVPSTVDCVRDLVAVLRSRGRCAEAEASTRLLIARDPGTAEGYALLADTLAAQGSPKIAEEEALRQRWPRLSEPERSQRQLYEQALVDALAGDLGAAGQQAEGLARLLEADPSLEPHLRATLLRVEILAETGRGEEAAAAAWELFERKSAWSSAGIVAHGGLGPLIQIVEPRILEAARHGGRVPEAGWMAARDRMVGAVRREGNIDATTRWMREHAVLAETPAEAAEALRAMPGPPSPDAGPGHTPAGLAGAFTGRVLRLGGRLDEAVAELQEATASCSALDDPFLHVRAHLWLGQALEEKGEKAPACEAYRAVLRLWGKATPQSVSAETARRRSAALSCPP